MSEDPAEETPEPSIDEYRADWNRRRTGGLDHQNPIDALRAARRQGRGHEIKETA